MISYLESAIPKGKVTEADLAVGGEADIVELDLIKPLITASFARSRLYFQTSLQAGSIQESPCGPSTRFPLLLDRPLRTGFGQAGVLEYDDSGDGIDPGAMTSGKQSVDITNPALVGPDLLREGDFNS